MIYNSTYNKKIDIWSLGVILYELATLKHPFYAKTLIGLAECIKKGEYDPIPDQFYSLHLQRMIRWLLQTNQTKRPSISQVLKEVEKRLTPGYNGTEAVDENNIDTDDEEEEKEKEKEMKQEEKEIILTDNKKLIPQKVDVINVDKNIKHMVNNDGSNNKTIVNRTKKESILKRNEILVDNKLPLKMDSKSSSSSNIQNKVVNNNNIAHNNMNNKAEIKNNSDPFNPTNPLQKKVSKLNNIQTNNFINKIQPDDRRESIFLVKQVYIFFRLILFIRLIKYLTNYLQFIEI